MKQFNKCIGVAQNVYQSCIYTKKTVALKSHFVPFRGFLSKWTSSKSENVNRIFDDSELKPLTGIDDPNFTDNLKKSILRPNFKESFRNLNNEFRKLGNEIKTDFQQATNYRIDSRDGRVDMLFTFETKKDVEKFFVSTDSSFYKGLSSASLKHTEGETVVFSGNICKDFPKDGNVKVAGYANMSSVLQEKSFFRTKYYNWTDYTHLVFKIRGDGRTYLILIHIHTDYEETKYWAYAHPLYTRGGPYWQIAKIPLSHFFSTSRGSIHLQQNRVMVLHEITRLGITQAGCSGPFKLEIDYIGLEHKTFHNAVCPYESYR